MRVSTAILSLPLVSLAACGGGGAGTQSLGSIAPPIAGSGSTAGAGTSTSGGTATPTATGGGLVGTNPTTTSPASFLAVNTATTFDAIGATHNTSTDSTGGSLYVGHADTVSAPTGTITFNPRDGIFTVALSNGSVNYQDPGHRSDFNPSRAPIMEVPNFPSFNYLVAAGAVDGTSDTFFYERPGNVASYVSLAGFLHSSTINADTGERTADRGVMVFGSRTSILQVPGSGSGHFEGDFLATMIATGSADTAHRLDLPLQWISGSSAVDVDFGKLAISMGLHGVVSATYVNNLPVNDLTLNIPTGATFDATGNATLNSLRSGFTGKFSEAYFSNGTVRTNVDFAPISAASSVAGASSIDGAFYGPNAVNVGGNFRITGGVPDQRVDILGAFTAAKK